MYFALGMKRQAFRPCNMCCGVRRGAHKKPGTYTTQEQSFPYLVNGPRRWRAVVGCGPMMALSYISVESQHISVWEYIELPEAKIEGAKSDHP